MLSQQKVTIPKQCLGILVSRGYLLPEPEIFHPVTMMQSICLEVPQDYEAFFGGARLGNLPTISHAVIKILVPQKHGNLAPQIKALS